MDQVGINVTWKPGTTLRVVKQLTRKRTLVAALVAIFLYVVFGQWLMLTVATVAVLTVLATLTVVAVETRKIKKAAAPKVRQRRHVGEIYLSELPGFLWILLAGAEYRRQAAGILERRAKAAVTPIRASTPDPYGGHAVDGGPCALCGRVRRPKPHAMRTVRAEQVAEMARAGKRPAEIAELLGVSPGTIRRYLLER